MKKNKLLIIILSATLVLIGATFAILYFATDIFKKSNNEINEHNAENKQMFHKYIEQADLKSFTNSSFKENYAERLKNNKYKENTKITIKSEGQDGNQINKEINIESKKDLKNKLVNSQITVGNEEFILNYLREEDAYGILFKDIVNQYVVVENDNLKDFATKLGVEDVSQIPDKIEFDKNLLKNILTEQETDTNTIKHRDILLKIIPDICYSKIEKEQIQIENDTIEADGYKITITTEQLKQILTDLINEIMNDEQLYQIGSKINPEFTKEEYKEGLESALESINAIEITEENKNIKVIEISVYKQEDKTKKIYAKFGIDTTYLDIAVEFNNNSKMEINYIEENEKQTNIVINKSINTEEQEKLNIVIESFSEDIPFNVNINVERIGKSDADKIENKIELRFENEEIGEAEIELINKVEFDENIELEKFTEENKYVINELKEKQITSIFTNLGKLISEKVEDETTYIYAALGIPFAVIEGDVYEQLGYSTVTIVPVTILTTLNAGMFQKAENALQQTKEAMVYEAIQLAKAEIVSKISVDGIEALDEITEELIAEKIGIYLDSSYNVKVKKTEGKLEFTVLVDDIELDGIRNKLDFSSFED